MTDVVGSSWILVLTTMTTVLLQWLAGLCVVWLVGGSVLASAVATYQERKIWLPPSLPSLTVWGLVKVFCFNLLWCTCCFVGAASIGLWHGPRLLWAIVVARNRVSWTQVRTAMADQAHYVSWWTAVRVVTFLIGHVQVHGLEHLPPLVSQETVQTQLQQQQQQQQAEPNTKTQPPAPPQDASTASGRRRHAIPAPVYIANHASQLDVALVYFVLSQYGRFQWVAKQSIAYLPGVGQIALLAQNILIRKKPKSQSLSNSNASSTTNTPRPPLSSSSSSTASSSSSSQQMFAQAKASILEQGIPVMFFPQGTRWMANRLPFREGAFVVAQSTESPLIPLSIDIPPTVWNAGYPVLARANRPTITLTVHKPVAVTATANRPALKERCTHAIYQALPHICQAEQSPSQGSTSKPKES